ncbi:MAG: 3-isopropylmalate dehydratase [Eubacteriales bacterium]|nr:3-isopropylmalate dehydratase [Eubacteriales bacterium]
MIEGHARILGDNISGDYIISKEYIRAGYPLKKMVKFLFQVPRPDLGATLQPGDIIVGGHNFGCGSSREFVMLLLKEAKINCVIAKSFARTFYRSSINQGILPIECDLDVKEGDVISVDIVAGTIIVNGTTKYQFQKFPALMKDIVTEGGLIPYYVKNKGL